MRMVQYVIQVQQLGLRVGAQKNRLNGIEVILFEHLLCISGFRRKVFIGDRCWHPDSILTLTVFQSRRFFTLARPSIKYMLHSLQIFRHISCMVSILTI